VRWLQRPVASGPHKKTPPDIRSGGAVDNFHKDSRYEPQVKIYVGIYSVTSILPSPADIRAAAARISSAVVRTPFRRSAALSEFAGGDVWLKLECDQSIGSFKIRGATNVLASMTAAESARGVVASSAGNHGLGVAAAARALGISATVFVPRSAPAIKRDKIAALGATVDATAEHYDAAEVLARARAEKTGESFVGPCTGRTLLAGQGTVALEMLEDLPSLRTVIVGVGGGGLAGGVGGFLRAEHPDVTIIGAQSERTNAMALAIASGRAADTPNLPTIADGLTGLVDDEMLAQGQAALHAIVTVSEEAIINAIAFLWKHERITAEGAGAAGVAALLSGAVASLQFPLAIIISGGNIDPAKHAAILSAAG
jgi:threonine dehydratase